MYKDLDNKEVIEKIILLVKEIKIGIFVIELIKMFF